MSDDDVSYFTRRAQEERAQAAAATDRSARRAHETIADEYERIAAQASEPHLGQGFQQIAADWKASLPSNGARRPWQ